jgi:hypothetical protein
MVIQKNCEFIKKATSPVVSKIFPNSTGDTLSLQISGADGTYHLEGRNSSKGDWVSLAGINLSDFSAVRGSFTKAGLYEIGIVGVREMRVRVESASGEVSIFGQIISTEET